MLNVEPPPVSYKERLFADANRLANEPVDPAPGWPIPAKLTSRLRPVPPFKETLFPPALRPALSDVAYRMQCPPDWPAVAWLVMLGAVVGNRCGIRPKQRDTGWVEVPNLWGAIVAEPSSLKTPVLAAALAPLKEMERVAREVYRHDADMYEAEADVLKARKEAIRKKLQKAADKGNEQELQSLKIELMNLDLAAPPIARRYIVNDSTVEKLIEVLGANPHGVLVFRDELTGLLLSWDKTGREGDRQFYLEGWNGTGDYSSDRIGRGSLYVASCCLSLLGSIQPDKLAGYLQQTLHGENDGMTQRFSLLTWPDPRPFVYVDEAPNQAAQAEAVKLLHLLDELDPIKAGASLLAGDAFPTFHFDEAAQEVFVAWLTNWQRELEASDEAPALLQHLSKYRKLYPALALLFHLLDVASGAAPPGPVSRAAAELADQWCTYFAHHARRVYAYGTTGAAEMLGKQLQAQNLPNPFTLRDVQRKGWQGLGDRSAIQCALEDLVDAGWIREAPALPPAETGRPRATAYESNPRIFSDHA
ncbi:YfjI family protein [Hymenobacter sp. BT491]|uniref:YfjI family protein n=1 Tax=Hymenobacter sp. BT491 TaxID=2766779 RepID=UPI001653E2C9|nr:YfjI family protein [Hymenobacter sp. BT491]MBC6991676.1 DUF3987 domain-containing protein [Hymenobacter sp. BT491]